jgi:hypothetical protein
MDLGVIPSSFELLCVCIVSGSSSFIAATTYRPGSVVTSAMFFMELSDVLNRLVSFDEPIVLNDDINIRLEQLTDFDILAVIVIVNIPICN